jgi:hypothetical protein
MTYAPEEFLDTLDRMIDLSCDILDQVDDEEIADEVLEDIAVLRDLHHRIRLQFGIEEVVWN